MKSFADSCLCVAVAVLLFAAPAHAATAKIAAKPAAKPVAEVIEPQPDPALLIARSRDAQSRGETDLALRLAQSAIVADPARPSAYTALGDVYAALNQPDFARSYYSEALAIDPADFAALKAMAALGQGGPGQQAAKADSEGTKTGTP
ncbi:MAG TPA: tetratricopeptide repeat protein [Rhizomicrobium sp.]|nr:tetratricopeptide repeat protein [Rhizomicrobium sp.]